MFTGIVEEIGIIDGIETQSNGLKLTITAKNVLNDLSIGASIAVNGVCLTVIEFNHQAFSVEVVPETIKRTNLGKLKKNSYVNLERSARINARLDGHIVQGHIDSTAQLNQMIPDGNGYLATFTIDPKWMNYIVIKGYIAIDGMSITVVNTGDNYFTVTFIPHTYITTRTKYYQLKDEVNIEVDIIGKYIEKLMINSVLSR